MYKYDRRNMYDGTEYLQNILLETKNINIKSWHVFLSQHVVKNLQSMIGKKKKNDTRVLNVLHGEWHVNPCHITLGPHNIHANFFKLQIT